MRIVLPLGPLDKKKLLQRFVIAFRSVEDIEKVKHCKCCCTVNVQNVLVARKSVEGTDKVFVEAEKKARTMGFANEEMVGMILIYGECQNATIAQEFYRERFPKLTGYRPFRPTFTNIAAKRRPQPFYITGTLLPQRGGRSAPCIINMCHCIKSYPAVTFGSEWNIARYHRFDVLQLPLRIQRERLPTEEKHWKITGSLEFTLLTPARSHGLHEPGRACESSSTAADVRVFDADIDESNKVIRPMAKPFEHVAEEWATCMQVDLGSRALASAQLSVDSLYRAYSRSDACLQASTLARSLARARGYATDRHATHLFIRAVVAERLAYSPPTKAIWVRSPLSHRILACGNRAGRYRWSEGSLGDLLFPPALVSGTASYSPLSPSSALKTTLSRAAQISLLTQSGPVGVFLRRR
ncbi:hypothetical protein PR048_007703 [Dryococelus australis]|uniref:DUF4817 domain-containing protein n=1 Tax=Dryococelus australis TaxID=614101 RepID=A0ABQ9HVV8_9NEOP|nr:hypothetical protein PR048_007703 [Dryococelus australis]